MRLESDNNFFSRHIIGSFNTAKQTAELIRTVVSNNKWTKAKSLIEVVKIVGKKLIQAQPLGI
jgi:translation initiation factor eIF-2B subunit beta